MLARIGVKVDLLAEPKATYFPKVLSRNTSFYLLGWTPGTYDSHNPLFSLMSTPGDGGQGQFNLGSYSNARVDQLTREIASETDATKRQAMISEAFKVHAGRHRTHSPAPADAHLGHEEEHRAGAVGGQLQLPEVGGGEVKR